MLANRFVAFTAIAGLAWCAFVSPAHSASAKEELAPTGKLRVAVAVSPSPSAFFVVKGAAPGTYKGVVVTLGTQLAAKLGVPLEIVPYDGSGEITRAASTGVWDVTFMPVDAERKKSVDFGAPYHILQSTYLVGANAKFQSVADVNKPEVRIAGVSETTTIRASIASAKAAQHVPVKSVDEAVALLKAGKVDAIALSRESLSGLVASVPGARILQDSFYKSTTAVAVPKGKPAALAYATAFVEDAKASGAVRKALDDMGLTTSEIAPHGIQP